MTQVNLQDSVVVPRIIEINENEGITTTTTFTTILDVSARFLRESIFIIHNKGAGDLDYQILGNARNPALIVPPDGLGDDDNKGWVVIKSSTQVASGAAPAIETLSNPYSEVIVQIKHTVAFTTVNAYHRGDS